jgi:hypothetical protein
MRGFPNRYQLVLADLRKRVYGYGKWVALKAFAF